MGCLERMLDVWKNNEGDSFLSCITVIKCLVFDFDMNLNATFVDEG